MKTAVVYFSWSGNTRFAAETIAKKTGADLYEIKAETPYNSNYGKCCDEAQPECYGKTLRPIKPIEGLDLAKYDLVFVGSPNWWGTMAPPVRTWVSQSKEALKAEGINARVVSMPCVEAFERQSTDYRNEVLPVGIPRIVIEAGATAPWYKYTGFEGAVIGMDTFGASGKANKLFEYFGFTVERVVAVVKDKLGK